MLCLLAGAPRAKVRAYSSGAGSCSGPGSPHGSSTTYEASVHGALSHSPLQHAAGETVTVTLAKSAGTFAGFLLQLPSSNGQITTTPSGTRSKTCAGSSARTHSWTTHSSLSFDVAIASDAATSLDIDVVVVATKTNWARHPIYQIPISPANQSSAGPSPTPADVQSAAQRPALPGTCALAICSLVAGVLLSTIAQQ